ncbi:GNAT family N-acetyltransferase [Curtobacterium albidum]|uniref:GNAT family N-acetyltransferase n=1 Tax=Curtobacterium citreum TaxID=2036 RepID=UPI0020274D4D|nr:GNAT family N-acetyltransferase [Curtobacterium albidum]MCL9663663.1 GNAT family N-acetyltransferase [Curtobacterium albidum]
MGTTHALTVRPADVRDADAIAAVHVQAWREAYAHLLPAEFLAALDVDARAARWRGIVAEPDVDVLVATVDDTVAGWASAGPGRGERPRDRELEGIYVLAEHHGSGAGQALLDAAIGAAPAFLWVADGNPRAEAFYRRNGFERDGTVKHEPIGPHGLDAVRMVR